MAEKLPVRIVIDIVPQPDGSDAVGMGILANSGADRVSAKDRKFRILKALVAIAGQVALGSEADAPLVEVATPQQRATILGQ